MVIISNLSVGRARPAAAANKGKLALHLQLQMGNSFVGFIASSERGAENVC